MKVQKLVSLVLCVIVAASLLWAAFALTCEHYDGYEYILSAWTLWGSGTYFMPKCPAMIALLALIHAPFALLRISPSLVHYHVPLVILALGESILIARWIRRFCPTLSIWTTLAICCGNTYFLSYAPFALSDITVGFLVFLWWWADTAYPIDMPRGQTGRTLALAACALGRPQTAIIPAVCMIFHLVRTRKIRPLLTIGLGAILLYIVATGILFRLGPDGVSFGRGVFVNFDWLRYYYHWIAGDAYAPFFEHPRNLAIMLGPVGLALTIAGAVRLFRRPSESHWQPELAGLFAGSVCFFLFLVWMRVEGPQYLSPLLPAWALLQCVALAWLNQRCPKLATAAVAALVIVSLAQASPAYLPRAFRDDHERRLADRVTSWGAGRKVIYAFRFPARRVYDLPPGPGPLADVNDNRYFPALLPFRFYTPATHVIDATGSVTLQASTFPVPENLKRVAPPEDPLVVPPIRVRAPGGAIKITPWYILRWFPPDTPRPPTARQVGGVWVDVIIITH